MPAKLVDQPRHDQNRESRGGQRADEKEDIVEREHGGFAPHLLRDI